MAQSRHATSSSTDTTGLADWRFSTTVPTLKSLSLDAVAAGIFAATATWTPLLATPADEIDDSDTEIEQSVGRKATTPSTTVIASTTMTPKLAPRSDNVRSAAPALSTHSSFPAHVDSFPVPLPLCQEIIGRIHQNFLQTPKNNMLFNRDAATRLMDAGIVSRRLKWVVPSIWATSPIYQRLNVEPFEGRYTPPPEDPRRPPLLGAHLVGPPNGRQEEFLNLSLPMFGALRELTLDFPRLLTILPIRRLVHLRALRLRHSQDSWCLPLDLSGIGDLTRLQTLDLSYSWCLDFGQIASAGKSLRRLVLHHAFLHENPASRIDIVDTLAFMEQLEHLDMAHDITRPADGRLQQLKLSRLLRRQHGSSTTTTTQNSEILLPHLTFLDLSGYRESGATDERDLVQFLLEHPFLTHLGLCSRTDDASFYDVFTQAKFKSFFASSPSTAWSADDPLKDNPSATGALLRSSLDATPVARRLVVSGTANVRQMMALLRQPEKLVFMDEVFRVIFEMSRESSSSNITSTDPELLLEAIVHALKEARRLQRELELQRHHFCSEGFMIIYDVNKVKTYLKTRYNLSINGLACLGNLTQTSQSGDLHCINPNLAKEAFQVAYECFEEHYINQDYIDYCAKCQQFSSHDRSFLQSLEHLRELLVKNVASICINLEPLLLRSTSLSRIKMCDVLLLPCVSDNLWITQDLTLFGLFVTCFNRIFTSLPTTIPSSSSPSSSSSSSLENRENQSHLHDGVRYLIRRQIVARINENLVTRNPDEREALLSALWNLTDENPFACQTLVEVGGLEFLVKLMKRVNGFKDREAERCQDLIRIMGILLNVGLCRRTRKKIEQRSVKKILVEIIEEAAAAAAAENGGASESLRNPMLGFLASGILAAIACDDPRKVRTNGFWIFDNSADVLRKIKATVLALKDPFNPAGAKDADKGNDTPAENHVNNNNEPVPNGNDDNNNDNSNRDSEISLGFTSFKSIFTMLRAGRPPAVHQWALWGVANACGAQPDRHVPMLRREGGFELLEAVVATDKDADVQRLAKRLIEFSKGYLDQGIKGTKRKITVA